MRWGEGISCISISIRPGGMVCGQSSRFVFGRFSVRISAGTLPLLTTYFCRFLQSLLANAGKIPRLGYDHFLLTPSNSSLIYLPTIRCYTIQLLKALTTEVEVQLPVGVWFFFPLHVVQTGSEAHPDSYTMGIEDPLRGGKAVGGVKPTIHLQLGPRSRMRGFIYPLSHTSSRRSA
jgi:hypothetical protein